MSTSFDSEEFARQVREGAEQTYHPRQRAKANGAEASDSKPESEPLPPLAYVDLARDPIPERKWAVRDRIPAGNVTLLSGEGAIGKSIILLQLAAAHVLAIPVGAEAIAPRCDWIGTLPEPGPVLYWSCEEDADEICRRLVPIAEHYGTTRQDLKDRGLHVISRVGQDSILAIADRNERVQATPLFHQIKAEIARIKPVLVIIDNAADVFAGNEISRTQTRQFVTLLRSVTHGTDAAVILSAHPSLEGIRSGSGLSGSTAWHNSVRARMFFHPAPGEDPELRVLETMKSNYSAKADNVLLHWSKGIYKPEPGAGSLEKLAAEHRADEVFLRLLARFTNENRKVSCSLTSNNAAPKVFHTEQEAKEAGVSKEALKDAMSRLMATGKIKNVAYGPPSKGWEKLVITTSGKTSG
jgi:RecA-family ATPase